MSGEDGGEGIKRKEKRKKKKKKKKGADLNKRGEEWGRRRGAPGRLVRGHCSFSFTNESIRLNQALSLSLTHPPLRVISLVSSLNRAKERDDIPPFSSPLLHPHCPAKLKSEDGRRNRPWETAKTGNLNFSTLLQVQTVPSFSLLSLSVRYIYPLCVSFPFFCALKRKRKKKNSRTQNMNQGQARTNTETEKRV